MSSVRRSSRANKGQNRKLEQEQKEYEELLEKSLQEANQSDNQGDDDDELDQDQDKEEVSCLVCGTTDENFDEENDTGDMIECDQCDTWQHNACVLKDPKTVPKTYKCYICDKSNDYFKTLKFKIDPKVVEKKRAERLKKKETKKQKKSSTKSRKQSIPHDDNDFVNEGDNNKDDAKFSDNGEEEDNSDEEYGQTVTKRPRLDSKTFGSSSSSTTTTTTTTATRARKTRAPPVRRSPNLDEIDTKARLAVTERFNKMFLSLLPGNTVPSETDSIEEISSKWAKKLEDELFAYYHDRETGKLTKDYKEASARIFSNVRDIKNTKLRTSIINKSIPFSKLVKMPVNELLNPDLRKEKEDAIKESMDLATFKIAEVSKIRRTHKGDILLENDESSNQTYDLNVGISIDNDEKKFIKSETHVNSERKNSLYAPTNDNFDDEEGELQHNDSFANADHQGEREVTPTILEEEDEDFEKILTDATKKKIEGHMESQKKKEADQEANQKSIWEGQTVFPGITSFNSELKVVATTLTNSELDRLVPHMLEHHVPLVIEGRLDARTGDHHVQRVAASRRLLLLELKDKENPNNFFKLYDYFFKRDKYGVIPHPDKPFIKDAYILPIFDKNPRFLSELHKNDIPGPKEPRLFLIYIIKQEMINQLESKVPYYNQVTNDDEYDPTAPIQNNNNNINNNNNTNIGPNNDDDDLSFSLFPDLNPDERALVRRIFQEHPETRQDTNLLIQHLQSALSYGSTVL